MPATFIPNTAKAVEVILWLASERSGIDLYHVVKCAFYADKYHLNHYGRPVIGDRYEADEYGPLGRVVYGLLRRHPFELLALESNGDLPISVDGPCYTVIATREPNLRRLSRSDVEALRFAVTTYADKSFNELVEMSHAEPAYIAAGGGAMRYEDMIDDGPHAEERRRDLAEVAAELAL
jgi:uncharacterized phage-associated protein